MSLETFNTAPQIVVLHPPVYNVSLVHLFLRPFLVFRVSPVMLTSSAYYFLAESK